MNPVFAKKSSGGGDGSSKDKGGGSSGGDKGGGSGGSSGSSDTGGRSGRSGSSDTGSTSTPPPTTEETTPPPPATDQTTPPPPAAENQQQTTCPDGSTPDENGKCPTTTLAPNQPPAAAQDGGHILVMPNPDGTCPAGSHKFPGSQVCEKDTVPPTSDGGTTTTTPASNAPPLTPQQQYEECLKGIGGGIPGNCKPPPTTPQSSTNNPASNAPPLTPQQQYENCLRGIGGGIPGNCKPPTTIEQNTAPLQTLTQKTCPPLPIDANGRCPGIDMRGGGLGLPPVPPPPPPEPQVISEGNGAFRLPTVQPIFNDPLGNPLGTCPSGSHKVITKCVVNNVQCPTLTSQFEDRCSPIPPANLPTIPTDPDGTCHGVFDPPTNKCYKDNLHAPPCPGKPGEIANDAGRGHDVIGICQHPQTGIPLAVDSQNTDGTCPQGGGVHIASSSHVCFLENDLHSRNIDGSCQSGYLAIDNSCKLKIHDPLPDGSCPAGYHNIPAPNAPVPRGTLCKHDLLKLTSDDITSEFPGGYCPVGYRHVPSASSTSLKCFRNS